MKVNRLHIVILALALVCQVSVAQSSQQRKATSLMLQGVQALEDGRTDMAKKILEAAQAVNPEDDAIQYYLGYIAASASDAESALKHFSAAWQKDSTNYWYGIRLSKVLFAMRRFDEARKINGILLATHPGDAEVISGAVDLALQDADPDRADSLLNRIDLIVGPTDYSRVTRLEILRQKGDFKKFFSNLNEMFKDKNVPGKSKKDMMENMLRGADPRFNYVHLADYDTLVATCLKVHPTDTAVLYYAAGFYSALNRPDAVADLCNANPQDLTLASCMMFTLLKLEDYEKALDACEKVISLCGENEDALLPAIVTKADCHYRLGEEDAAFREYERALKINPDDVTVLNNYAYWLAVSGRKLSKAARMSRVAVAASAENATFLDTYGWILYKQKKYQSAKVYLKKAMLYGGKESAEVLDHYAAVLEALGENSLAVGYREQAKLRRNESKK